MEKNSTVMVIGGAGYIGSHASKALKLAGLQPVVFDNLSTGHRHAVKWGPLIEGDIRDAGALEQAFNRYAPCAVMHFAACIEVGDGERDPQLFYNNNVCGTLSLLQAMRRADINKIVFSSTCATYGEPQHLPLRETEKQKPVNVYGRTKLMVEHILEDFSKAYGLRYAALRYFNAAGADRDAEIGEEHDPETHLIPNALKAAMGLSGPMHLFGDDYDTPDGTCVRDYIHVSDLAVAHVLALQRLLKHEGGFALNVGVGKGASVRQVLMAVERATGKAVPYTISPRRPGDAASLYADPSRAARLLGFKAIIDDIDHIVADAWRFHKRRWGKPDTI